MGLFAYAFSAYRSNMTQLARKIGWIGHCLRQVDHVAAQRVRRTHQWVSFNRKIWPGGRLGRMLHELVIKLATFLRCQRLRFLLSGASAAGLVSDENDSVNNLSDETACPSGFFISDDLMERHKDDVQYITHLKDLTLTCGSCSKRHFIDQKVENVDYCECSQKVSSVYGASTPDVAWTPFLERKDILVWRQEHPEQKGQYAYKMYGRFDDVSAFEFLEIQMDVSEFRLSWDKATAQCYVIEEKRESDKNVSQVYYWEVNWPRFFANRDYVCGRRAKVFNDQKLIVIYSQSTNHSACPQKCKNFRVTDYWSVLTIKPFTEFDQLGIEFSLTAFENPGLSMPSSVTTWVAIRAMPDFMSNLRQACLELRTWKTSHSSSSSSTDKDKSKLSNTFKEPSYIETPKYRSSQTTSSVYA